MNYRYRKFGEYLVCVDQSILEAVLTLIIGFSRHRLDSLGASRRRVWNAIKIIVKSKVQPGDSTNYISLPVFGHLGMQVHRGYKLFDFRRSEVTKAFNTAISTEEANNEIAASRTASLISSAPRFFMADSESAWFREEYIRGTHATDLVSPQSSDFLSFYPDVESCLVELIGCQSPSIVDISDHIDSLASDNYRDRWLSAGIPSVDVDRIENFIESTHQWLGANSEAKQLELVLTHGDFSLVNAVSTDKGLRFIDWEGIRPGSVYSDIFNFLFAEHYYGRSSPEFASELVSIIQKFRTALLAQYPDLYGAASSKPEFSRRLYYLERIRLMIDRDVTLNLNSVVAKSIAMFNEFDSDTGEAHL